MQFQPDCDWNWNIRWLEQLGLSGHVCECVCKGTYVHVCTCVCVCLWGLKASTCSLSIWATFSFFTAWQPQAAIVFTWHLKISSMNIPVIKAEATSFFKIQLQELLIFCLVECWTLLVETATTIHPFLRRGHTDPYLNERSVKRLCRHIFKCPCYFFHHFLHPS